MNGTMEAQILDVEEQLRIAMLLSDVSALDELLGPELLFTNHLGQLLSKKDDLEAHRSGVLKVNELTPSEQHVHCHDQAAVVSVIQPMATFVLRESGLQGPVRPDGTSWPPMQPS
jgi:hypothetical protein